MLVYWLSSRLSWRWEGFVWRGLSYSFWYIGCWWGIENSISRSQRKSISPNWINGPLLHLITMNLYMLRITTMKKKLHRRPRICWFSGKCLNGPRRFIVNSRIGRHDVRRPYMMTLMIRRRICLLRFGLIRITLGETLSPLCGLIVLFLMNVRILRISSVLKISRLLMTLTLSRQISPKVISIPMVMKCNGPPRRLLRNRLRNSVLPLIRNTLRKRNMRIRWKLQVLVQVYRRYFITTLLKKQKTPPISTTKFPP